MPILFVIEAFCKAIKRDTDLFIELTKTTSQSIYMVYNEAQNFVNVEKELNSTKGLLSRTTDKLIPTKKEE